MCVTGNPTLPWKWHWPYSFLRAFWCSFFLISSWKKYGKKASQKMSTPFPFFLSGYPRYIHILFLLGLKTQNTYHVNSNRQVGQLKYRLYKMLLNAQNIDHLLYLLKSDTAWWRKANKRLKEVLGEVTFWQTISNTEIPTLVDHL